MVDTNILGVYFCMKHEIAQMLTQGKGAIVNLASIAAMINDNRVENDIRRRAEELKAKEPLFEAQRRERRRVATILTQRFIAHALRADQSEQGPWTLEMAHRAWRQPRTDGDLRELAENIGLPEFYTYDPYALEMNSVDDDAVIDEYAKMLGQIDIHLQELIRENGSAKRLVDLPELADVMANLSVQ
jgi:hypothetical protein